MTWATWMSCWETLLAGTARIQDSSPLWIITGKDETLCIKRLTTAITKWFYRAFLECMLEQVSMEQVSMHVRENMSWEEALRPNKVHQYSTLLYWTVLYCTVLYFTVLHCTGAHVQHQPQVLAEHVGAAVPGQRGHGWLPHLGPAPATRPLQRHRG